MAGMLSDLFSQTAPETTSSGPRPQTRPWEQQGLQGYYMPQMQSWATAFQGQPNNIVSGSPLSTEGTPAQRIDIYSTAATYNEFYNELMYRMMNFGGIQGFSFPEPTPLPTKDLVDIPEDPF